MSYQHVDEKIPQRASANSLANARSVQKTRNAAVHPQNRYVKAAVTLAALVIALNVCTTVAIYIIHNLCKLSMSNL